MQKHIVLDADAPNSSGGVQQVSAEDKEAVDQLRGQYDRMRQELAKVIIGQDKVVEEMLICVLSRGHGLLMGVPGLAKTLMVNSLSKLMSLGFSRIQFTPDLMPSDITGTEILQEGEAGRREFEFVKGPIFANIILADEINRTPPKTQAALLEAMQEHQVTLEGHTHQLQQPFVTVATQNPIESEGTYPLPEAQLDRFMMKLSIGYPSRPIERAIIVKRMQRMKDEHDVRALASPEKLVQMQVSLEKVKVDEKIIEYIVEIVNRTREDPRVAVGSSPRGTQALFKLTRALAVLNGRDYVVPDDVKRLAIHALRHRLILKPEPRIKGVQPEEIISQILQEVEVPTTQGYTD